MAAMNFGKTILWAIIECSIYLRFCRAEVYLESKHLLTAVEIIEKLGLATSHKNAAIIDTYPGIGVWSAAVHNAIEPKKHIMLEPYKQYHDYLVNLESPPDNTLQVLREDPYRWTTFSDLVNNKLWQPQEHTRKEIHPDILYLANLTGQHGEQLCMQYLNCVMNQSWLQRYGRVRMLFWIREDTALKLLARPGDRARHRATVQAEASADIELVASVPEASLLTRTPLMELSSSDFFPEKPVRRPVFNPCLVKIDPKPHQPNHIDSFEYVIKMLFILRKHPLMECLGSLGPGAKEALSPDLKSLLKKCPQDLSLKEIDRVVTAFHNWPFKPTHLHAFFEPQNEIHRDVRPLDSVLDDDPNEND
jgi:transcription factor 1